MNKITFLITFVIFSIHGMTLNLSNTYNKDVKMSIKSAKDYKTYRLDQLKALRNQGMNNSTYIQEVERLQNITQIPLLDMTEKLDIDIEDIRLFDRQKIKNYLNNIEE